MKKFLKEHWKFLLFVLIAGLIGGYCTGYYFYDTLSNDLLKQLQEQNISRETLALTTAIQYGILYGLFLAILGIVFSKKVNLWKEFKFSKEAVPPTVIITVLTAFILFPGDKWMFGSFSSWVKEQYTVSPGFPKIVSGLLLGGVIEEVMMRLFLMSLFVWILSKVFYKKEEIPVQAYIIANILSALLFAAGHIPSTMAMTTLTPLLVFRCFLLNGGIGLSFGWLYRKYNLGYAMIAHGFAHLIADMLMLIFV